MAKAGLGRDETSLGFRTVAVAEKQGLVDAVARTLGTSPAIAALNAASSLGAMLTAYAPTGAVAAGLALV